MIKWITIFFCISTSSFASKVPLNEKSAGVSANLKHFHRFSPSIKSLVELNTGKENKLSQRRDFKLGLRARIHKNVKISAYYQRSYGLRHQNDWIVKDGKWHWIDSSDRGENIFGTSISLKELVSLNILEFKTSIERNFKNNHNTLKLRPGITHIFLNDGSPFINIFLQYEAYFPLNYHDELIYKKGIYSGVLYHWRKNIKPGLFFKVTESTWSNSDTAISKGVEAYKVKDRNSSIGLTLNLYY